MLLNWGTRRCGLLTTDSHFWCRIIYSQASAVQYLSWTGSPGKTRWRRWWGFGEIKLGETESAGLTFPAGSAGVAFLPCGSRESQRQGSEPLEEKSKIRRVCLGLTYLSNEARVGVAVEGNRWPWRLRAATSEWLQRTEPLPLVNHRWRPVILLGRPLMVLGRS
jgi:hypothetical protein